MALLISFLIGIQTLSALARNPPDHTARPTQLLSPGCNASAVKTAAELALHKINADRREGYVFGLQRIFDVQELHIVHNGSVFYLTLDVLETVCHVLSGKSWKDCHFRVSHETVHGQCKATLYVNKQLTDSQLCSYDCVARPLSSTAIARVCPDCPVPSDPTQPRFLEAADVSLRKYNAESNHIHYFAVLNVTKARYQWVIGPSHFVEYTIQETSCSKATPVPDVSKCPLLPFETAATGLCKGSVIDNKIEREQLVSVTCELYEPLQSVTDEQNSQPGPGPGQDEHGGDSEGHGDSHQHHHSHRRHGRHRHRHPHKHRHRHHNRHSHGQQEGLPSTSAICQETAGRVIVFPLSNDHVSLHSLPEIEAERLDGKPVPPETQVPKLSPNTSLPDIHGVPEERHPRPDRPGGRPTSTKPAQPVIPPFPTTFSQSDACPGNATIEIIGLILPHRPVRVSPPAATLSPKCVKCKPRQV